MYFKYMYCLFHRLMFKYVVLPYSTMSIIEFIFNAKLLLTGSFFVFIIECYKFIFTYTTSNLHRCHVLHKCEAVRSITSLFLPIIFKNLFTVIYSCGQALVTRGVMRPSCHDTELTIQYSCGTQDIW